MIDDSIPAVSRSKQRKIDARALRTIAEQAFDDAVAYIKNLRPNAEDWEDTEGSVNEIPLGFFSDALSPQAQMEIFGSAMKYVEASVIRKQQEGQRILMRITFRGSPEVPTSTKITRAEQTNIDKQIAAGAAGLSFTSTHGTEYRIPMDAVAWIAFKDINNPEQSSKDERMDHA